MKLTILGATGSIGGSALDLAERFPDRLQIVGLSGHRQVDKLARAVLRHRPRMVAAADGEARAALIERLKAGGLDPLPEIITGPEGLRTLAVESGAEMVLSAQVGAAGFPPTWAAVERGLKVALANKESLVLGGELLMPLARRTGAAILPVDSEHSAIFQALGGFSAPGLRRLIITASGGAFRGRTSEELRLVTAAEALRHPRWSMGPKITCDSATMMNKGLELIEAHHLFGLDFDRLTVLVHPQSLVHSLVEFIDGSQLAQLGPTDMRLAIAYAFSHPGRWPLLEADPQLAPLDLARIRLDGAVGRLTFEEPDRRTFKALALAEAAGRAGGTAPALLNGANEEAVELFLQGRIGFTDIADLVEETLAALPAEPLLSPEQALAADAAARVFAREKARPRERGERPRS